MSAEAITFGDMLRALRDVARREAGHARAEGCAASRRRSRALAAAEQMLVVFIANYDEIRPILDRARGRS